MTGMGSSTQRHFVAVRERMANYVDEQQEIEYDGFQAPPPPRRRHILDRILGDAQPAPKSALHTSTSGRTKSTGVAATSRKHLDHLHLASPSPARRARKPSSTASAK